MKSILHVKNFGPIKDAKLDLRNVNVLIGPQASGKSTLAKLFTICKSPLMYFEVEKNESMFSQLDGKKANLKLTNPSIRRFQESLDFFSLSGYFNSNSEITFQSPTHNVRIMDGSLIFEDTLKIDELLDLFEQKNFAKVDMFIKDLTVKSFFFRMEYRHRIFWKIYPIKESKISHVERVLAKLEDFHENFPLDNYLTEDYYPIFIKAAIKLRSKVFDEEAMYVPAERIIVNLIKQASLNFQRSKIPIAGHLLDYAAKYESATFSVKKFDLIFLSRNAEYRYENGEDSIYFSDHESIRLTDSASGFQSVVPMLLPLAHSQENNNISQSTFVIEEPETNLFPGAQYEVIKFIEKGRKNDFGMIDLGAMHIYTTHSPFILSSLNNMLYGFKKGKNAEKSVKKKIDKVISEENWINPDDFAAYEIKNGKAKSIFSRKTGLINETVIDVVSEDIMNDFRKIAVISAEANVEK